MHAFEILLWATNKLSGRTQNICVSLADCEDKSRVYLFIFYVLMTQPDFLLFLRLLQDTFYLYDFQKSGILNEIHSETAAVSLWKNGKTLALVLTLYICISWTIQIFFKQFAKYLWWLRIPSVRSLRDRDQWSFHRRCGRYSGFQIVMFVIALQDHTHRVW